MRDYKKTIEILDYISRRRNKAVNDTKKIINMCNEEEFEQKDMLFTILVEDIQHKEKVDGLINYFKERMT